MIDKSGSHVGYNKLVGETIDQVIRHIDSFPKYISHYCRATTEPKLLRMI